MQWSQHGSTSTGEPTAQSRAVASIASVDAPNTSIGKLKYCLDVSDTVDNMIFTAPDQPCVEIYLSLNIFDIYLSIYLFTKIVRIFIYLFISKRSNNI